MGGLCFPDEIAFEKMKLTGKRGQEKFQKTVRIELKISRYILTVSPNFSCPLFPVSKHEITFMRML